MTSAKIMMVVYTNEHENNDRQTCADRQVHLKPPQSSPASRRSVTGDSPERGLERRPQDGRRKNRGKGRTGYWEEREPGREWKQAAESPFQIHESQKLCTCQASPPTTTSPESTPATHRQRFFRYREQTPHLTKISGDGKVVAGEETKNHKKKKEGCVGLHQLASERFWPSSSAAGPAVIRS